MKIYITLVGKVILDLLYIYFYIVLKKLNLSFNHKPENIKRILIKNYLFLIIIIFASFLNMMII